MKILPQINLNKVLKPITLPLTNAISEINFSVPLAVFCGSLGRDQKNFKITKKSSEKGLTWGDERPKNRSPTRTTLRTFRDIPRASGSFGFAELN